MTDLGGTDERTERYQWRQGWESGPQEKGSGRKVELPLLLGKMEDKDLRYELEQNQES